MLFCAKVYIIYNMYKILRIICCVISALLVTACVFVFVYLGIVWGISTIIAAGIFFVLTILFKNLQQDKERENEKRMKQKEDEEDK